MFQEIILTYYILYTPPTQKHDESVCGSLIDAARNAGEQEESNSTPAATSSNEMTEDGSEDIDSLIRNWRTLDVIEKIQHDKVVKAIHTPCGCVHFQSLTFLPSYRLKKWKKPGNKRQSNNAK